MFISPYITLSPKFIRFFGVRMKQHDFLGDFGWADDGYPAIHGEAVVYGLSGRSWVVDGQQGSVARRMGGGEDSP